MSATAWFAYKGWPDFNAYVDAVDGALQAHFDAEAIGGVAPQAPRFERGPDWAKWSDDVAWFRLVLENGELYRETGAIGAELPKDRVLYGDFSDPKSLAYSIAQSFAGERTNRIFENVALVLWAAAMAVSIAFFNLVPAKIGCGGDLDVPTWAFFIAYMPLYIAAFFAAIVVLLAIYKLARNQPEGLRGIVAEFGGLMMFHYRRAPTMWTVSCVLVVLLVLSRGFGRYDLRIHENAHYTTVHDRLVGTWRTYHWVDCPPSDEEQP